MVNLRDIINAIDEIKILFGGIERDIYFDLEVVEEIMVNKNFENMNYKQVKSLVCDIIDDEVSKQLDILNQ